MAARSTMDMTASRRPGEVTAKLPAFC
jgi:hypothetical protein